MLFVCFVYGFFFVSDSSDVTCLCYGFRIQNAAEDLLDAICCRLSSSICAFSDLKLSDLFLREKFLKFIQDWMELCPSDFFSRKQVAQVIKLCSLDIDVDLANRIKLLLLRSRAFLGPSSLLGTLERDGVGIVAARALYETWREVLFSKTGSERVCGIIISQTSSVYVKVRPSELVDCAWQKKPFEAKHIILLQQRFEQLNSWVVTVMLVCESVLEQFSLLQKFIEIAQLLYEKGDLLDAAAVVAALGSRWVSRLKYAWSNLTSCRKLQSDWIALEALFSPNDNFAAYRSDVSQSNKSRIIPYIPVHLRDIFALSENAISKKDVMLFGQAVNGLLGFQAKWRDREPEAFEELSMCFVSEECRDELCDEIGGARVQPASRKPLRSFSFQVAAQQTSSMKKPSRGASNPSKVVRETMAYRRVLAATESFGAFFSPAMILCFVPCDIKDAKLVIGQLKRIHDYFLTYAKGPLVSGKDCKEVFDNNCVSLHPVDGPICVSLKNICSLASSPADVVRALLWTMQVILLPDRVKQVIIDGRGADETLIGAIELVIQVAYDILPLNSKRILLLPEAWLVTLCKNKGLQFSLCYSVADVSDGLESRIPIWLSGNFDTLENLEKSSAIKSLAPFSKWMATISVKRLHGSSVDGAFSSFGVVEEDDLFSKSSSVCFNSFVRQTSSAVAQKSQFTLFSDDFLGYTFAAVISALYLESCKSDMRTKACEFCAENLESVLKRTLAKSNPLSALKLCFLELESTASNSGFYECGCSISAVLISRKGDQLRVFAANVGDCPIVMSLDDGKTPRRLFELHRCSNSSEESRILKLGGMIIKNQVSGLIDVTRAIGLQKGKRLLSAEPNLSETQVSAELGVRIAIGSYSLSSVTPESLWGCFSDVDVLLQTVPDSVPASIVILEYVRQE